MVTSEDALSAPSSAVRRRTYDPASLNVAELIAASTGLNVTVPGPDTLLQPMVSACGGFGLPSSVAVPARLAPAGSAIVWFAPALAVGAAFIGGGPSAIVTTALGVAIT